MPRGPATAADHIAVVTFDVTAGGIVPVARNHRAIVTAGGIDFCSRRRRHGAE